MPNKSELNSSKIKAIIIIFLIISNYFTCILIISNGSLIKPFNSIFNNSKFMSNPDLSIKTAKKITDNPYTDNTPDIAIDSNDTIHLCWCAYGIGNVNIMYANSSDNFTNVQRISNISIWDRNPCIVVDSNNIVHITWEGWEGSNKIYYTNSSVKYEVYTIISKQNSAENPQIGCDSVDNIHIIWMGYNVNNWDIFYANSSDFFSTNKQISKSLLDDALPDLCVRDEFVHIVWTRYFNNSDNHIIYVNSSDNYVNEQIISLRPNYYTSPRIAVDGLGCIHIAWNVYYYHEITKSIILLFYYISNHNELDLFDYLFIYSIFKGIIDPPPGTPAIFHIHYSNSFSNFKTQKVISKFIREGAWFLDILTDSDDVCHIIWQSHLLNSGNSRLLYTNSTEKFEKFKSYPPIAADLFPKIASDSNNEIHCVFSAWANDNDIYYLKISDL